MKTLRGLSNAIAGLIVFTFLLLAIVPLVITLSTGSIHSHLLLSTEINKKLSQVFPGINITLTETQGVSKTYIVKNISPRPIDIAYYVVSDGSSTYLVKAPATFNNVFQVTKSLTVETLPVKLATILGNNTGIRLGVPLGEIKIVINNGELLSAITVEGARIPVNTLIGQNPVAQYAAVAGSIKTNYVSLNNFTSLEDLANSNDIVLTTDPSSQTTNKSILNYGVLKAVCFTGDADNPSNVTGGFQPFPSTNNTVLNAIYIQNIGPWIGSMILGGRSSNYSEPGIGMSLYVPTYILAAYNTSEPGVIMFSYQYNGQDVNGICIDWIVDSQSGTVFGKCYANQNTDLINYMNTNHVMLTTLRYSVPAWGTDSLTGSYKYFYSPLLGLLLYNDNSILYCPPGSVKLEQGTGSTPYYIDIEGQCRTYVKAGSDEVVEGYTTTTGNDVIALRTVKQVIGYNNADSFIGDAEIVSEIPYQALTAYVLGDGFDYVNFPEYPVVIKVMDVTGDSGLLSVYDGYRGTMYHGADSFGIYYYSGYYGANTTSEYGVYYYIERLYGEHGRLSVFHFQEGSSSGLRPYTIIADTDGNGLAELIFTDEWFKPGPVVTVSHVPVWSGIVSLENPIKLYDISDAYIALNVYIDLGLLGGKTLVIYPTIYNPLFGAQDLPYARGCDEYALTDFVYMKFTGRYAVYGGSVAEVSIQIRYSFHDALGGDIEEIDNPKNGVWGFFIADSRGNIVSSSVYIYQQLANLEDTWPPSTNFVSDAVFLPVPDRNETFYVLYGFSDSYLAKHAVVKEEGKAYFGGLLGYTAYGDWYTGDLEYTVRIEWLGMWYLHR